MYSSYSTKIIMGPIIGKVTATTARILLEIDNTQEITLVLEEDNSTHLNQFSNQNAGNVNNNFQYSNQINNYGNNNHYNNHFSGSYNNQNNFGMSTGQQCNLSKSVVLYPKTPFVFQFEGLKPNQRYSVRIEAQVEYSNPELASLKSSFRTIEYVPNKNTRFVFMSCNSYKIQKKYDIEETNNLWKNLSERIHEIDYCIHMGDQIYADDGAWVGEKDNCYTQCQVLWEENFKKVYGEMSNNNLEDENQRADLSYKLVNPEKDRQFEEIKNTIIREKMIDRISEEYRKTWNMKYTANVLRNVPNIMIIDDHEIYDDFGWDDPHYADANDFRHFFAEMARVCYYRYQKLLWQDIDFSNLNSITEEYHSHVIGGVGIFLQDFRGCRVWHENKDQNSHILGQKQFNSIAKSFSAESQFSQPECKAVIYVAASPMVFFAKGIADTASLKVNDALEQWSLFPDQQVKMLQIFNDFRERSGKNVVLLSGDVHVGLYTSIYQDRAFILEQMTTSPIFQKTPTATEAVGLNLLLSSNQQLAGDYSFVHKDMISSFNFGIVEFRDNITTDDRIVMDIWGKHVYSSVEEPPKETAWRSLGYRIESRDCVTNCGSCNIY